MVEWIEIKNQSIIVSCTSVSTLVVEWIEIGSRSSTGIHPVVSTLVVEWIEISFLPHLAVGG